MRCSLNNNKELKEREKKNNIGFANDVQMN
jgi:hypothetical protein